MNALWGWIQRGYLRVIGPVGDFLVRHRVKPNTITTIGTMSLLCSGARELTAALEAVGVRILWHPSLSEESGEEATRILERCAGGELAVAAAGGFVYAGGSRGSLLVIDARVPGSPRGIAQLALPGGAGRAVRPGRIAGGFGSPGRHPPGVMEPCDSVSAT